MSHKHKTKDDVPLVEFMYLVTCQVRVTVGNSGLCSCVSVASFERYLVCWFCTGTLGLALFKIVVIKSHCYTPFVFCLCLYSFAMNFCWDERSNFDGLGRLVFVDGFHCVFTTKNSNLFCSLAITCLHYLLVVCPSGFVSHSAVLCVPSLCTRIYVSYSIPQSFAL